jgi:23S rRNA (guanine2445-N2)-methyltransferase / 23S rRNA (guanine2069-N7)-methyltransferase
VPATHDYFATAAKGIEPLLEAELRALGAEAAHATRGGVAFRGALEVAYRTCLWSRVANRVLLPLASFPAPTPAALYDGVRGIRWSEHLDAGGTLAVDCATAEAAIGHSHFAALKTKDAIADQFRDRTGVRPSVDLARPHVRVNVHLHKSTATVSLDLSGDSLHRRGYRTRGGEAPLKENLAAAILLLAEWPRLGRERVPFLDPLCGSGTLPIEAALMAADLAPGRGRAYFGFLGWRQHDPALWRRLLEEAEAREIRDSRRLPIIRGYDADAAAVGAAIGNLERAGLRGRVHIERRALRDCEPIDVPVRAEIRGLLVANPPYGERLGATADLGTLYATLGDLLRRRFLGWTACVLTGNPALAKQIGLRPSRRVVLYNGAIECRLLTFPISATPVRGAAPPGWRRAEPEEDSTQRRRDAEGAETSRQTRRFDSIARPKRLKRER